MSSQGDDGSWRRSGKSLRNEELKYTDQERDELLRRLDSIKDHLLRVDKPKEPIYLHGPKSRPSSYYNPFPYAMYPSRYSTMLPYSPVSEKLAAPYSLSIGSQGPRAVSDTHPRTCYPLACGAPFIACLSCFELLYLPKKKLLVQERLHKLQCGACFKVMSFAIVDKKLVFNGNEEEELSSIDFNNSGSDFPRKVKEKPLQDLRKNRSESKHSDDEKRLSISSEKEQKKEVKSVRRRVKDSKAPEQAAPPENASLLELFEYSNVNRAALAYGMSHLGSDKQESFMKPESIATETEVSYNGFSEDSRYSKGSRKCSESGSTITMRSSSDQKSLEVWVNGHLIPENLVSNAEKLAGQVQAGKYWYDYRAGFWGVMGTPCLGVIPPFIEEFNHPMPENCAAGNTQVFVNGRELHKRDFKLLVGRGLPRDKNRSYIVDISGRVLDGDSGKKLKSLGKLAPTIEKVKHGFGMRVPRSLAS